MQHPPEAILTAAAAASSPRACGGAGREAQTPMPVDPELLAEKETMLAELRDVRERTLAFMDETKERNLGCIAGGTPSWGA